MQIRVLVRDLVIHVIPSSNHAVVKAHLQSSVCLY
jgi:hypothetical protein